MRQDKVTTKHGGQYTVEREERMADGGWWMVEDGERGTSSWMYEGGRRGRIAEVKNTFRRKKGKGKQERRRCFGEKSGRPRGGEQSVRLTPKEDRPKIRKKSI